MGDRGQVLILPTKVYLYTHWSASDLAKTVQDAMKRKQRWNDEEYLARIIFDEMTKEDVGNETGYGIGTQQHGDIWKLVVVDCDLQHVEINTMGGDDSKTCLWSGSFRDFIELKKVPESDSSDV